MTSENNCIIEYVDNACVEMSSDEIGVKKHNNFCDEPYDDSFDHNCVDAYIENVVGNVDCVVDNVHANPLENVGDINTKRDDDICDNSSNACKNATYDLHDNALKCRNDFWDNVSTLFDNDEIVECNEFELLDLVDNNVLIDGVDNVNACVEYAVGKDRSEGVEIESRKEEVEDKKKTRDESVREEVEEKIEVTDKSKSKCNAEGEGKAKKVVQTQNLCFKILKSQIETGTPYGLYKDSCKKTKEQPANSLMLEFLLWQGLMLQQVDGVLQQIYEGCVVGLQQCCCNSKWGLK
nr:ribonucleoside-diphosphate reductase large subunit [Ipomoea batatas]